MNELDMEEIGHKVVRLEERYKTHTDEITEIKDVAKSLLETSRYQSHTIDQILKELEADRVSKNKVHDLELKVTNLEDVVVKHEKRLEKEEASSIEIDKTFAQARFVWKIAYGILTTPVLLYIGFKVFEALQHVPS